MIDDKDARFGELRVWVDANGNGTTEAGELKTLAQADVTKIGLGAQANEAKAQIGDNVIVSMAGFERSDGSVGGLGNVALAFEPGKGGVAPARTERDPMQTALDVLAGQSSDTLATLQALSVVDESGASATEADRLVALMRQDMAAFGAAGSGMDGLDRLNAAIAQRFDWYAA